MAAAPSSAPPIVDANRSAVPMLTRMFILFSGAAACRARTGLPFSAGASHLHNRGLLHQVVRGARPAPSFQNRILLLEGCRGQKERLELLSLTLRKVADVFQVIELRRLDRQRHDAVVRFALRAIRLVV